MLYMYKITTFSDMGKEEIEKGLKGLPFKKMKTSFEWRADQNTFQIVPFANQPQYGQKGYRAYFNGNVDGGIYLFDMSLGWCNPNVTGVEYTLTHEGYTQTEWRKELRKRPSIKTIDAKGMFKKGNIMIVLVGDQVHLQIRGKSLKLIDCLREIEIMKGDLLPDEFNLFSFVEGGVAI